jgi:cytochrome c biogenesis protein
VVKSSQADGVEMLASKGKLSLWGPYLTHVSILIIFFGAILGNILGFGGYTAINEGSSTSKYYRDSTQSEANLGFRVALRKFEIGHDIRHNPTAYRSDLVVYEGNNIVAQKVIDVNHPLTYKGVSFFQSDYGLAGLIVKITSPSGETQRLGFDLGAQSGPHGRTYAVTGEPFKEISVGGKTLTVFVHNFLPDYSGKPDTTTSFLPINPAAKIMVNDRLPEYKGLDAWSNLNWLEVGKSAKYKGFTVTLEDVVDYTGLQVSRNPGLPIIYIGFGLLLLGVFLSFYVVHKIVRLRIAADGGDVTVLMGASSREEPTVFDADFQRLRDNYRGDQS